MANPNDKRFHSDRDIYRAGDEVTLTNAQGDIKELIVIHDYRTVLGARLKSDPTKTGMFDMYKWHPV